MEHSLVRHTSLDHFGDVAIKTRADPPTSGTGQATVIQFTETMRAKSLLQFDIAQELTNSSGNFHSLRLFLI
jgi:hypothetical protein